MNMTGPSGSSEKTLLEEVLSQCVEKLEKGKLTNACDRGVASEPAAMRYPFENPNRGNEASGGFHPERGFKSNEKMGPRPSAVGKHNRRQQRQTSKGPMKIYPADPSNFKELVHEYTSKPGSCPRRDVTPPPTSPLTPHSPSSSSTWGLMSQPSSPATPHCIRSSSASPLSSPPGSHPKVGPHVNSFQVSNSAHTGQGAFHNTHRNAPCTYPCQNHPTVSHNANLHQSIFVPRSASMPCLGLSTEAENAPSDNGQPHGMSPELYNLERFLLKDEVIWEADWRYGP